MVCGDGDVVCVCGSVIIVVFAFVVSLGVRWFVMRVAVAVWPTSLS